MSMFIVNRHCGDEDCDYINITVDAEFIMNRMSEEDGIDILHLTKNEGARIHTVVSLLEGEAPEND